MNIIIRTGDKNDISKYTKLMQSTYQYAYVNDDIGLTKECFSEKIFNNNETRKYLLSHLINTDDQKTWLTFDNEKLIGSITCILKDDNEAELTGFYVDKNYHGKGIGKELYKKTIEFAKNRNLILDIYNHNTKTIEIYKKWGWVIDESRGENGYFYRHWPEWPKGLKAKCMYMRLQR